MNQHQGFSLIEVLISLMLVSMTALGLLQQQWQSTQLFTQMRLQTEALIELDNASELLLTHPGLKPSIQNPFQLRLQTMGDTIVMAMSWQQQYKKRCLSRMLYQTEQ